MAAIAVTQSDLTAMELRVAAGREKNSAASRRMLALAMVLDGADRTSAAKTCGMDRQTLRDWVHRYNAAGLTGLRNRKSSGRPPKLTAAQKAVLVELVENHCKRQHSPRRCAVLLSTGCYAKLHGRQIALGDCNRRHRSGSPSYEEPIDSDF